VKRKKPKDKRNTPPKRKTIPKATRRGYNSGYSKEEAERITGDKELSLRERGAEEGEEE
jgi:hypothetical protein